MMLIIVAVVFFVGVLALVTRFEMRGKNYALSKKSDALDIEEEEDDDFSDFIESEVVLVEPEYIHEQVALYTEPTAIIQPVDYLIFDLKYLPAAFSTTRSSKDLPTIIPVCLTPIAALKSGLVSRVPGLIAARIYVDEIDPTNGYTIIHYLAMSYNFMALDQILEMKTYAKVGGVNARALDGDTPLHLAVRHPVEGLGIILAYYLMLHGANPAIRNNKNESPLDYAYNHSAAMFAVLKKKHTFPPNFGPTDQLRLLFKGPAPADPYYCYGMAPPAKVKSSSKKKAVK